MRRLPCLILAAAALAASAQGTRGDIIHFNFAGVLSNIVRNDNSVLGAVGAGTPFAGSFWYDTGVPDADTTSDRNGEYTQSAFIEVTIGGARYSFEGESAIIRVRNYLDADFFQFSAQEFGSVQSGAYRFFDFGLYLTDSDASAFSSDALPTNLNASRFNTRTFRMIGERRDNPDVGFWITGTVNSITLVDATPPPPLPPAVRGDFSADRKADVLWRNPVTGRNVLWLMNGATRVSAAPLPAVGNRDWQARGIYDFDLDDASDVIWRNTRTGANVVWRMQGGSFVESITLPALRGNHWILGGVGDFDKDGNMDMLWRNTANGNNRVWRLDGSNLVANTQIAGLLNPNWRIAGVDDFDGNGGSDIVWRNRNTGEVVIWIMNALWRQSVVSLGSILPIAWEVAGIGDYTGDGTLELLFYNPFTGLAKMALLDGYTVTGVVDVSHAVTRGWTGAGHEAIPLGSDTLAAASVASAAPAPMAALIPEPTSGLLVIPALLAMLLPRGGRS